MCIAADTIISKDVKSLQIFYCEWTAKGNLIFELCFLKAVFSINVTNCIL